MTERVDKLIAELTLDEKASLTAGADMWTIPGVERVGIPAVTVTDGPNGARGTALFGLGNETAVCVPCGSALGATWDPALVERVGVMLGEEALTKACRVLLAPTLNLHRSPTGGRNFECYSEDPLLAGKTAAAFVRGVQSQGVATTPKHFVGNDAEFERNTVSSVIDPRTLRELYLVPFELAVKEGGALGIMTGYNRVNGTYNTEHVGLLREVLRDEWGFEGFVVTDWFGALSTERSPIAGVDVEMPGPGRAYGAALAQAVRDGVVDEALLDERVARYVGTLERLGVLDAEPFGPSTSVDRPEHRALARAASIGSMVLLKNEGVLPFDRTQVGTLAVLGPSAERPQMMGGGSASLAAHYEISPLDALREAFGDGVTIAYERGCVIDKTTPPVAPARITAPDGRPGLLLEQFEGETCEGEPTSTRIVRDGTIVVAGDLTAGMDAPPTALRITGTFTPAETGPHTFTFVQILGEARVTLGGEVVFDGIADPPGPGSEFFGMASEERAATLDLVAGEAVPIVAEYRARQGLGILRGLKIGLRLPEAADMLDRAVAAAAAADAAIVVVGTNADWESEGHDRASMDLPGDQAELARRVCAANPNTVVVVNTGSPVTMDWADEAPAILQAWFGGQEMANAIAAIVIGDADPGGRLPTTLPLRYEHNPSFGNFPGENSEIRYGEGLLMGYRWYDSRHLPVRFPFGHGLSYTSFTIGAPSAPASFTPGTTVTIEVPVTNTGDRTGSEVVQCYVEPVAPRAVRPLKELRAFAKAELAPGESTTVRLELGDRAFAYWDEGDAWWASTAEQRATGIVPVGGDGALHREAPGWYVDPGEYRIIGRSSADIAHRHGGGHEVKRSLGIGWFLAADLVGISTDGGGAKTTTTTA
ncbi:MAG: glycoside hydrolase family 3 C-terminal domain-containing protein [Acidimicrobiia bacterium]